MSISGCGDTLVQLLDGQLRGAGLIGDYTVSLFSPREITASLENTVALILYRVNVDPTRRHVTLPRLAPTAPVRIAMALELRYLLVAWGSGSALGEQVMLGHCMDVIDRHAVISGPLLAPGYPWEADDALKISIDPMETDDLMRIWDAIDSPYQLSVGYVARTVRLAPRSEVDAPMTSSRTLVFADGVPG